MAFLSSPMRMSSQLRAVLLACIALTVLAPTSLAELPDEYEVKALFLYNFARFFEFPGELPGEALCIAVVGHDPFRGTLEQLARNQAKSGRSFCVRHYKTAAEARGCHIVFIPASDARRTRAALDALKGSNALVVGETPGFCQSGGIVNFELSGGTVRFEINPEAVARAGLKASSKLLSLAKIVHGQ